MRDYVSSRMQQAAAQLDELIQLERTNRGRTAGSIRRQLLKDVPPAAVHEYFEVVGPKGAAENIRSAWQEKNYGVDCLHELTRDWRQGNMLYNQVYAAPKVILARLPFYSFVIQFTFTLAQAYLSRDEQDFYIIDNPVRKDKISGLPYVASSSWKGSLRSACWQLQHASNDEHIKDDIIKRLFGNDKDEEEKSPKAEEEKSSEEEKKIFHAGSLYFFPTFFTRKGLEIINPQNREKRVGSNPILFESVPADSPGIFTLLYVPFITEDVDTMKEQAATDLEAVIQATKAMFRIYGFGAKTHSGFGQAQETIRDVLLEMRAIGIEKISASTLSFEQLTSRSNGVVQKLKTGK